MCATQNRLYTACICMLRQISAQYLPVACSISARRLELQLARSQGLVCPLPEAKAWPLQWRNGKGQTSPHACHFAHKTTGTSATDPWETMCTTLPLHRNASSANKLYNTHKHSLSKPAHIRQRSASQPSTHSPSTKCRRVAVGLFH